MPKEAFRCILDEVCLLLFLWYTQCIYAQHVPLDTSGTIVCFFKVLKATNRAKMVVSDLDLEGGSLTPISYEVSDGF